ncbi:MAG: hypothetical protein ACRDPQ_13990 [Nocardioidaceae bacterium]
MKSLSFIPRPARIVEAWADALYELTNDPSSAERNPLPDAVWRQLDRFAEFLFRLAAVLDRLAAS